MESQPSNEEMPNRGALLNLLGEMEKMAREKLMRADLSPEERASYEKSLKEIEGFRSRQNN